MSTRLRGEANGYNKLIIDGDDLTIVQRIWNGHGFVDHATKEYRREASKIVKPPHEERRHA
jgi:hypothetical protein